MLQSASVVATLAVLSLSVAAAAPASVRPEPSIAGPRVVQGEHLEHERHDDAEGRSEDQNLIEREVQQTGDLEDLDNIVGDRCRGGGDA